MTHTEIPIAGTLALYRATSPWECNGNRGTAACAAHTTMRDANVPNRGGCSVRSPAGGHSRQPEER
jgi:hypothetical protein